MRKTKDYTVKVHPKYMVVLPKEVRETLGIRVGDRVDVKVRDHIAEISPVRKASLKAVRDSYGMFKVPSGTDVVKAVEDSIIFLAKDSMVKKRGKHIR